MISGSPQTQRHYDTVGWKRDPQHGNLDDLNRFGAKEDGPIRRELFARYLERIQTALWSAGGAIKLLECGCGGNPAVHFLRDGDHYTGVDFSTTGLVEAEKALHTWGGPFQLQAADICRLPFPDGAFDALFSAHVLYHIDNLTAQSAAIGEMQRILRSGGVAVLVLVNPRPLLFPIRLGMRAIADLPILGALVNRVRKKGPLPFRPMSIDWYKRRLRPHGTVEVLTSSIPTTWFNQDVTEYRYPSKLLWQGIRFLDAHAPRLSANLGNYFLLVFRKS